MCGICGIRKKNPTVLQTMQAAISHRGPDGKGEFVDNEVSLGHQRLAVIDLSDKATQPMRSADGRYVIVYNGELYNYRELRTEIGDRYNFLSESDTEVVLASYKVWGRRAFSRFRGIFAFAIWDTVSSELLLCRDQIGVKPLYYLYKDNSLYFSSELSGLRSLTENSLSKKSLSLYFGINYVPGGDSLLQGIKKVLPGTYITHKKGKLEEKRYYNPGLAVPTRSVSTNEIYETIDKAVERQLVSDRPVGVFLSGGIDSSIVLHHASQHLSKVRTFSVDFEMVPGAEAETEKFNADARLAEKTAAFYGAEHTTFSISLEDIRNNLEPAIAAMDEPVANPTAISQYLLSKWVRESGVVVALGGDGGDELFGGYTRHRAMMAASWYQALPLFLRNIVSPLHPKLQKLNTSVGLPLHLELMVNNEDVINQVTKENLDVMGVTHEMFAMYYNMMSEEMLPFDAFMRADRSTWLVEESLARSDRSSMAHGLELRVPLLDLDVVNMSDAIPSYQKTTPWTGKKVLRDAYRDVLPSYLYNQPKRGWISPGAKWLRDPVINQWTKAVLSSDYYDGLGMLFDLDELQNMLHSHTEKKSYNLYPIWNVVQLQVWAKKNNVKYIV